MTRRWYFDANDYDALIQLFHDLKLKTSINLQNRDESISDYATLTYHEGDMVSVKTDYNLHEKYGITNQLKEIQNSTYDGELKRWLIPKESVDEVLNLFEKLNINVIQSYEGVIEIKESDDKIKLRLPKFDTELFDRLKKIKSYVWSAATKTHLISIEKKTELFDLLHDLDRRYNWSDECENQPIKMRIKRGKIDNYFSPPCNQQIEYKRKSPRAKVTRKLNYD